jgi:hypothetical protein
LFSCIRSAIWLDPWYAIQGIWYGGLSDTKVRGAKGTGKAYKLSDGEQLYLHVSAVGGRVWRMNYHFGRNAQGKLAKKR